MGLFGLGLTAIAQPAPHESFPIEQNSAAVDSSSSIFFLPLTPSCPLPPIPVSGPSAEEITGISVVSGHSVSRPYTQGDGSDSDLSWRIREFLDEGQPGKALGLVPQIDDEAERAENLAAISSAYIQLGQLDQAEAIALSIPEQPTTESTAENDSADSDGVDGFPSPRERVISEIATHYIQTNQLEAALATLEHLKESSQISLLFDVAQRYREQGQEDTALTILDRALTSYRNIEGAEEWTVESVDGGDLTDVLHFLVLSRFAGEYAAAGQVEKATDLASELFEVAQTFPTQDRLTLDALTGVAGIYRLAEQDEQAIAVLNYVEQSTEALTLPAHKTMVLAGVVGEYEALGSRDRALEVLSRAQEFANATNDASERNVSTVALIQAYSVLGQYDDALQIAEAIEPQELRDQVQQAITCAQTSP